MCRSTAAILTSLPPRAACARFGCTAQGPELVRLVSAAFLSATQKAKGVVSVYLPSCPHPVSDVPSQYGGTVGWMGVSWDDTGTDCVFQHSGAMSKKYTLSSSRDPWGAVSRESAADAPRLESWGTPDRSTSYEVFVNLFAISWESVASNAYEREGSGYDYAP